MKLADMNFDRIVKSTFCSLREHFGALPAQAAKLQELVASSSNRLAIFNAACSETLYPKTLNVARKTLFTSFSKWRISFPKIIKNAARRRQNRT
jgi:hypothetical protein